MVISILKLMRVNHYVKNLLIFLPLFFSGKFIELELFILSFIGFIIFSLLTSLVYIFNDIKDIEKDRKHPTKKFRPLAANTLSLQFANSLVVLIFGVIVITSYFYLNMSTIVYLLTYFLINVLYTLKLKQVVLLDTSSIALGFVLRVLFGGALINVEISSWLVLTILAFSYFMAFGKRRNELKLNGDESREVLKHYSLSFLNHSVWMFQTLFIIFYALWAVIGVDSSNGLGYLIWSLPLLILIVLRYGLLLENNESGDPAEMLFSDATLLILSTLFVVFIIWIYAF